jgi:hypothetical protein
MCGRNGAGAGERCDRTGVGWMGGVGDVEVNVTNLENEIYQIKRDLANVSNNLYAIGFYVMLLMAFVFYMVWRLGWWR